MSAPSAPALTREQIAAMSGLQQMQAMLRLGFRSGAPLASAFQHVNDELCERLPDGFFITAFVGLLDLQAHRVHFISGGQAPILHYVAAQDAFVRLRSTTFPMGAMPMAREPLAQTIDLAPGDWLLLISDGVFEQESPSEEPYGRARVEALVQQDPRRPLADAAALLLQELDAFAQGRRDDDVTMILLRRER